MRTTHTAPAYAVAAVLALVLASCGSDGAGDAGSEPAQAPAADVTAGAVEQTEDSVARDEVADGELPTIAVTTNVLGDVVEAVVGDAAEVVTIMPVGADPHDFQASAQEVVAINNADALIVNGADFEEGLLDVIDAAVGEGVPTFEAIGAVDVIDFGDVDDEHSDDEPSDDEHADDEHSDDEHSDDEHSDDEHADDEHDDHGHSGADPHFFTDPVRMAVAVEALVDFLQSEVDFADPSAVEASAAAYIAELAELDREVAELVGLIPEERRVLVTNHEVFGYFADRYGFELAGVVIPGGGTTDAVSAEALADLAKTIEAEGVPAIFADTSASNGLVEALAGEVGDVAIVELYSESLGESGSDGDTYLGMVRTNAERISSALS